MNPHFFFLHDAFHMWCRAPKAPVSLAVKYMMVEEKKAAKEYNCPMVPVSSDDAPGRQRHRSRGRAPLEQFVVVQEEVDAKTK